MHTLNKKQLADLVGMSPRQVTFWIKAGMPHEGAGTRGSRLRIDPARALPWIIKHVSAAHGAPINQERQRLLRAQAEAAERENLVAEGELMSRDVTFQIICETLAVLRGAFLSLPSRMAGTLAAAPQDHPSVIRSMLKQEIYTSMRASADALGEVIKTHVDISRGISRTRILRRKRRGIEPVGI